MKQMQFSAAMIALVVVMSGCTTFQNANPGMSTSIPSTLTSTQVSRGQGQTETPKATITPILQQTVPESTIILATSGPTPTLPASTKHELSLGDLLFPNSTNCVLPCWQDLVPGKSSEKEVDAAILSGFGIDLSKASHADYQILSTIKKELAQEYFLKGYAWYTGASNSDSAVYLHVGFNKTSRLLELLQIGWDVNDSSRFKVNLSPLTVIRQLGAPSYMAAHPKTGGSSDFGDVGFLLIYPQGEVFQFSYNAMTFTTTPTNNQAIQDTHVKICLGTVETKPQTNVGFILGDVFLMPPFTADLNNLSPVQASVITDLIDFYKYESVEKVFGVSTQAIAAQAAAGKDVCLSTIIH